MLVIKPLKLVAFFACIILVQVTSYAQEVLEIRIERKLRTEDCIQGYLFVDGEPIAYTMELPWKDNAEDISAIPDGTYDGFLRYDKSDGWRIQLKGVPDRDGVQIHIGNYTDDITGCTLVGLQVSDKKCTLGKSKAAYAKLKEAFYGSSNPQSSPNKKIQITYK